MRDESQVLVWRHRLQKVLWLLGGGLLALLFLPTLATIVARSSPYVARLLAVAVGLGGLSVMASYLAIPYCLYKLGRIIGLGPETRWLYVLSALVIPLGNVIGSFLLLRRSRPVG